MVGTIELVGLILAGFTATWLSICTIYYKLGRVESTTNEICKKIDRRLNAPHICPNQPRPST